MVLTDRDRQILTTVYEFRLATREHIERLWFIPEDGQDHPTKTSICRKRLKLLYHHGYLARIPMPVGPGRWAWRPVYRLTQKGAVEVATSLGMQPNELAYWGKGFDADHRPTQVSYLFLEHTLKINDVRLAFVLAAKARGYQIETWIDDTQLRSETMKDHVSVTRAGRAPERVAVVPDAYLVMNLGAHRAHFFLELDMATMTQTRWKTRVLAYEAYMASGKYSERYRTRSLRVLTVTTSPARVASLKRTTEQAVGKPFASRFWFTTITQVVPENALGAPVWTVGGQTGVQPLISRVQAQ